MISNEFKWPVFSNGYEWITVAAPGKRKRLALLPVHPANLDFYHPLTDHTGLFKTFAALPIKKDEIRAFANRYGTLGDRSNIEDLDVEDTGSGEEDDSIHHEIRDAVHTSELHDQYRVGDYLEDWQKAITKMKEAVATLDLLAQDKASASAQLKLQLYCNAMLEGDRVKVEVNKDPKGELKLHIVPRSLMGAMSLQLALALGTKKEFRSCPGCGRWFEVSVERGRANQLHCSDACKARAYRQRKREAFQFAIDGWPPKKIAKHFDTDVATVKGWLISERDK